LNQRAHGAVSSSLPAGRRAKSEIRKKGPHDFAINDFAFIGSDQGQTA
jgi:hypothetical protein